MVENDILRLREIAKGDDDLMALVDNIEEASKDKDIILAEYKQLANEYAEWYERQELAEEAEKDKKEAVEKAVAKANKEAEKAVAKANKEAEKAVAKANEETAKKLLAMGMSAKDIAMATGLTVEKIENL